MTIKVLPPFEPRREETCFITHEEVKIIKYVYEGFGRKSAIRVAQALAGCDLLTAREYVDSL